MKVVINSWNGESFDDDNMCDFCGNHATVIDLGIMEYTNSESWFICKSCLLEMVEEIDKAILESKTYENNM